MFDQERNTYFNANYYFNTVNQLPHDRLLLHQMGAHAGGPIKKNKLFIFFNYEIFRFPATLDSGQLTVLNSRAQNGLFQYRDTTGTVREVDLYKLAAAGGFPSTPDPIVASTLSQIAKLACATCGGSLTDRVTSNNDYNRNNFRWFPRAPTKSTFRKGNWITTSPASITGKSPAARILTG